MLYLIKNIIQPKTVIGFLLLLVSYQSLYGQNLTGPSSVSPNSTHTYYYDDGMTYSKYKWYVTNGTKLSNGVVGTEYYMTIQWGASGTGSVTFNAGMILLGGMSVTIGSSTPSAPSMPTIENYPGYTRLTRGTPPVGETWYWQSTATGTGTSNSSLYVDRSSGTVYYLRSLNTSTFQWSDATTINYTVDPPSVSLSDENYIHTITPRVETTTDATALANQNKVESVTYFDGLGRPMQSIGIRSGGNSEDIITHIGYDAFGRQDKEFLPYALQGNYGAYKTDALAATDSYYVANFAADVNTSNPNPYSEKELEASPLNRVLKQAAPGEDWKLGSGHEIGFDYGTNTGNEVRRYTVSTVAVISNHTITYTPTLNLDTSSGNNNGYYEAAELYKTVTYDENHTSGVNHSTEEFKDKQGRVILKRTYGDSDINMDGDTNDAGESDAPHDTYYVYDDFGNLSFVLPPKMNAGDSATTLTTINNELDDLGYQYIYDERNRLVEKKIPGKGWEYIVYNKLDQPVLTQDANLRAEDKWLFTKYDAFGRVAYTGVLTDDDQFSRTQMENEFAGSTEFEVKLSSSQTINGTTIYYSNTAFPVGTNELEILTVNYYDNYTFNGFATMPSTVYNENVINYNNSAGTQKLTKGLATGSKVKVLTTSGTYWITTYTGYDKNGQAVYMKSVNDYLGTTDVVESKIDFIGQVQETTTNHTKGINPTITTVDVFTYDDAGRLLTQTNTIGSSDEELIVLNEYDALGQLVSKKVGGDVDNSNILNSNGLQIVDYSYNIRGWLKAINDVSSLGNDLFGLKINYNTIDHHTNNDKKLYNGNISEIEWKTANTDNGLKWYKYEYDALNRITSGIANSSNYNLTDVQYDKNGNITYLERRGHTSINGSGTVTGYGIMDKLDYNYYPNSNQLQNVQELSGGNSTYGFVNGSNITTEYTYDTNGNMLRDYNKGISTDILYNHLNLPTQVTLSGGNISYIYDATGVKLKKIVSSGTTTEYAGNYVYENGSLKFFNHSEGYVDADGGYEYVYQYKDHLGNVRLSYKDISTTSTPNLEIQEENNYYPFGLKHKGYNDAPLTNHKYELYNGVEFEEALGLNLYEMDVRMYDPAIGRFNGIDPVTHFSKGTSVAFDNNPIFWADPSGADAETTILNIFNASGNGWTWYNTGNGTFSTQPPKEGQTQVKKEFHPTTTGNGVYTSTTMYYHSGGLHGSDAGWYSEKEYMNLFILPIRDIASGGRTDRNPQPSIYWFNNTEFADTNFLIGLQIWIDQATSYYSTHYTPEEMTGYGNLTPMYFSSPFFAPGGVLNFLKSARGKGNIALGVREYLDDFAKMTKGKTWKTWGLEEFKDQFLSVIMNNKNRIHFNLDGISSPLKAIQEGSRGLGQKGVRVTSWELFQIYSNKSALSRTVFYRNGKVVPNPF